MEVGKKRLNCCSMFLVVAVLLVATGADVRAQNGPDDGAFEADFRSLRSITSFGLFATPVDESFNLRTPVASRRFGEVPRRYVFSGLTNVAMLDADEDTFDAPVTAGVYLPGGMPLSTAVLGQNVSRTDDRIDEIHGVAEVIETREFEPDDDDDDSEYDLTRREISFAEFNAFLLTVRSQTIVGLGPVNLGFDVVYDSARGNLDDPFEWAMRNRTEVDTVFSERSGEPPAVLEPNFTITRTESFPETETSLQLRTPIQARALGIRHLVRPSIRYESRDFSGERTFEFSEPEFGVEILEDIDQDAFQDEFDVDEGDEDNPPSFEVAEEFTRDDLTGGFGFGLEYFGDELLVRGDRRTVSLGYQASIDYDRASAEDFREYEEFVTYETDEDADGDLQFAPVDLRSEEHIVERTALSDFAVGGGGNASAVIPVSGDVRAALGGALNFEFERRHPGDDEHGSAIVADRERRISVNYDGPDDSDDNIIEREEIVTEYERDDYDRDDTYAVELALPSAISFRSGDLPFAIVFGARSAVTFRHTRSLEHPVVEERTRITGVDEDDREEELIGSIPVTGSELDEPQVASSNDISFRNTTRLGLSIFLPGEAEIDVALNGANLFQFDELTIQAVFPFAGAGD